MSTRPDSPRPPVRPRPGIVRALGITNLVISSLLAICLASSVVWVMMVRSGHQAMARAEITLDPTIPATSPSGPTVTPGPPTVPVSGAAVSFNPLMGLDDPAFTRFCLLDAATGFVLNGLMFASAIGLINLKSWGARWWAGIAWAKIARLVLLWGFYIVAVSPSLSESMGKNVAAMIQQQANGRGRVPAIGDFVRVYSIMNLIMAVTVIVLGVIYPAATLWLIGRPGVKAALVDGPQTEAEPS